MKYGIQISKYGSDITGAKPSDFVLDSRLETLPIAFFAQWSITVYNGYFVGVTNKLVDEVNHDLGYYPLFRGWEEMVVNGKTTLQSIPTGIDEHGFLTDIAANEHIIYIRAEFAAEQYTGPTYRKKGYLYVYEKEFEGLPT